MTHTTPAYFFAEAEQPHAVEEGNDAVTARVATRAERHRFPIILITFRLIIPFDARWWRKHRRALPEIFIAPALNADARPRVFVAENARQSAAPAYRQARVTSSPRQKDPANARSRLAGEQ